MNVLAQSAGVDSGSLGAFVVSVVVIFATPVAILLLGRLFERLF